MALCGSSYSCFTGKYEYLIRPHPPSCVHWTCYFLKISTTPQYLPFVFLSFLLPVGSSYGNELPVDYYTATNGLQGMNVLNYKIIVKFLTFQLCIQLTAVSNLFSLFRIWTAHGSIASYLSTPAAVHVWSWITM